MSTTDYRMFKDIFIKYYDILYWTFDIPLFYTLI